MGTLIFHILLFSFFLLTDVNIKGTAREEELLIEFPDIIPETEEEHPEQQEEDRPQCPTKLRRSYPKRKAAEQTLPQTGRRRGKNFLMRIT